MMNICDERHDQTRQVTYRGARGSNYNPVWLVCESCMDTNHFGSVDQIYTTDMLLNMKNTVLSKIKQQAGILVWRLVGFVPNHSYLEKVIVAQLIVI